VHWTTATNWVMPVMRDYGGLPTAAAVLCLLGMAGLLGLCWAMATGLSALAPTTLRVWAFPCVFIAVDSWRQFWPYRFPWNPPAAVLAEWPALLGSLPVWGATGLGWALVMVGTGLWAVLRVETRRTGLAALGVAVGLAVATGFLAPLPIADGVPVTVAVVQPGFSLEEKWNASRWAEMERQVWELTEEAANAGAVLVLWPESALPYRVEGDDAYRELLVSEARRLGIRIVLNAVGGSADDGYTNSVYVVSPAGVEPTRYDKVRLVPFGEFVPWWARVAFARSLVREVGSFSAGDEPVVLDAGVPLGMAVCYEVVFADLIAAEVRSGARLLATVTNDGWYGYSWAPSQHLAQVVLRAAESRRWTARAALTGISGFVSPSGRVVGRLDLGQTGVSTAVLEPAGSIGPRTALGDWWLGLTAVVGLVLLAAGRRDRGRGRPASPGRDSSATMRSPGGR
jgi:apolipoprotein N-acyltransferase